MQTRRVFLLFFFWLLFDPSFLSSVTDHSRPGAGRAGEEAEVGLQGGAAHLGHVLRELRATPPPSPVLPRETGPQSLQDLPKKGGSSITYLSSWELEP